MQTFKERRKAPRNPTQVPCDIYDAKGNAIVAEGQCVDFSILGARLLSRKPLNSKSPIRLQVVPSDKPVLDLTAKVIWARKKPAGFEYGICFSTTPQGALS